MSTTPSDEAGPGGAGPSDTGHEDSEARPAYGAFRHPKDLPQEIDPVAAYVDVLSASPHVRRLILFGSRAIGDHYPRSDVDMAVVLDEAGKLYDLMALCEDAATLISIDLVDYSETSGPFREAIDRHGRTVYERA